MNFKRFSCLSLIIIISIIVIIVIAFFFLVLGKAIFAQEDATTPNIQHEIPNQFKLYIPSLGIDSAVIQDVDASQQSVYLPIIENKVAHGKFTYTPEETFLINSGLTYLFSHQNSEANIFKELDKIQTDEQIYIKYNGNIYIYKVISKKIVSPREAENYTSQSSIPILRIQTCADGISKRLIVDSKLVGKE